MTATGGYAAGVHTSTREEQAWLVTLLRTRPGGKSWIDLTTEVRFRGGAQAALDALEPETLFASPERQASYEEALQDVAGWEAEGLSFLTVTDDRYPGSVRDIHQAPPFLFALGELRQIDVGVSVVGSREASPSGLKMATSIATALVGDGISVISGLAKGIDTAAHTATLAASGRPVGIIGTGIRRQYPAENRELHRAVGEAGLILSQFWPDAPPIQHQFPMRNATMSGYGIATVVVEATEHSGARTQARMAVEHGRPVILTDLVLAATDWAKRLEGRPGVHIASSTADVINVVRGLRNTSTQVDRVLDALVLA